MLKILRIKIISLDQNGRILNFNNEIQQKKK